MTIQRDTRICRLYLWALGICEAFTQKNYLLYQRETNLCRFVRTIVLYMPLVLLFQLVALGALVMVLVVLPVRWFGLDGYGLTLGCVAVLVGAICGAINFARQMHARPPKVKSATRVVIEAYLLAKKRKICPLVSIVGEEAHP